MEASDKTLLGVQVAMPEEPDLGILTPIERQRSVPVAYEGYDLWNAYEFSWLNPAGVPQVAVLQLKYPCTSQFLVESKSLKLFLGSFYNTAFESSAFVAERVQTDLRSVLQCPDLEVTLMSPEEWTGAATGNPGSSLDELLPDEGLKQDETSGEYHVCSNLLRSLCPVTGQPDYGSIDIKYRGRQINPKGILHLLLSFRQHTAFHEAVCEDLYNALMGQCDLESLAVFCRFLRRGGIDINPLRYTPGYSSALVFERLARQ